MKRETKLILKKYFSKTNFQKILHYFHKMDNLLHLFLNLHAHSIHEIGIKEQLDFDSNVLNYTSSLSISHRMEIAGEHSKSTCVFKMY